MPIIKSAIKRNRQAAKRRSLNLKVRASVKADVRALTDVVAAGEAKVIAEAFQAAQSEIDRAVKKGTLHKNTASRKKSRLSAMITKAAKPAEKAEKPKAATTAAKPAAGNKKPAAKKTSKK